MNGKPTNLNIMEQIIIKTDSTDFSALIREKPTLLHIKGKCDVTKNEFGKYIITNIQMFLKEYRIEAIGYNNCNSMVNHVCYEGNKRLGTIENIPPILRQPFSQ